MFVNSTVITDYSKGLCSLYKTAFISNDISNECVVNNIVTIDYSKELCSLYIIAFSNISFVSKLVPASLWQSVECLAEHSLS